MKHPEEIYKDINGKEMTNPERLWGEGMNRRHAYDLGHEAGYAKCLADTADHLAGYSNLTDAIKSKQPIDWEKLEGLKVQCVNPDVGEMRGELKRYRHHATNIPSGWWTTGSDEAYVNTLVAAWNGERGWSLYVEGDIPLTRKTADQLEVGHLFTGRKLNGAPGEYLLCTAYSEEEVLVFWASDLNWTKLQARYWEVIADHGPLQEPEGK